MPKDAKLRIQNEGNRIALTIEKATIKLVKRAAKWGEEVFLDAGEALVSE